MLPLNQPPLQVLAAFALILIASSLCAAPCTLYKQPNIDRARANYARYDWAKSIVNGWKRTGEVYLGKDRQFIQEFIPSLTPGSSYGQVCPNCVGKQCSMGETGVWQWTMDDPDKIRCRYCGTVYPNPQFPEEGVLECPRMGQSFTYYINPAQKAHPDEDLGVHAYKWAGRPVQVSFSGVIRDFKLTRILRDLPTLAKLYAITGDVRYAERTAWILDRLAQVFPNYLYHSYGGCFADCPPHEAAEEMGRHPAAGKFEPGIICHPAAIMRDRNKDGFGDLDAGFWGAGRMDAGAGGEGSSLLSITIAYDLTREAASADGAPIYSADMHERITRDLILAGCEDMENYREINNKCGPGRALSGAVGILFGYPERVRRALDGFEKLMEQCFHFDGFCVESPSYSSMHLGLMEDIPDLLTGYSDPEGYQPQGGERLDGFDPFVHIPRYRLALQSMARMLRPDLRFPVIGDTHSGSGSSAHYMEILAAHYGARYVGLLEALQGTPVASGGSEYALWHRDPDLQSPGGKPDLGLRTEYYPGWQVGVLRAGNDNSRTAFYFNGYSIHGHRHDDTLGIIYHALGRELASDRGYIWDDPRNAWTRSTLAHNIVEVDGKSQVGKDRHSSLELFGVAPGVEVIQASANAYAQCSQYRRTCALVRLPGGGSYVADIFRVTGGKQHRYALNGNGEFLGADGLAPLPLAGKISYLENLRTDEAPPDVWTATWRDAGVSLRAFLAPGEHRAYITDAPGWRSYKGDQLNAPPITQILAERTGDEPLASAFVAVLAPYEGEGCPVRSVQVLSGDGEAVCVRVELEGRTDYIVSALDDQERTFGPVTVSGRFAIASVAPDGRLLSAHLLDAARIACGGVELAAQARQTRKVVAVEGSVVTLDAPLADAQALAGTYLLTGNTGFEILRADGSTVEVREYPFEGGDEITVPGQVWFAAQ